MPERDTTTRADRELAIIDTFIRLSDTLVDSYDVIDFLHFLTARCVELADVDEAGVMLAAPTGSLAAVAASSERTRLLELYELQNLEGPCLDAFGTGQVVVAADLDAEDERWPTFTPRAIDVGFHAVHSVPMRLRNEVIGALNLLRSEPGTLDDIDASLVQAFADIATVGILQERTIRESVSNATGLQIALTSRIRIEQAKGVLAERSGGTVDEAFESMRAYARRHRLGITTVAQQIVAGTLDLPS
jgi:GAF domain-containing protein